MDPVGPWFSLWTSERFKDRVLSRPYGARDDMGHPNSTWSFRPTCHSTQELCDSRDPHRHALNPSYYFPSPRIGKQGKFFYLLFHFGSHTQKWLCAGGSFLAVLREPLSCKAGDQPIELSPPLEMTLATIYRIPLDFPDLSTFGNTYFSIIHVNSDKSAAPPI